MNRVERTAHLHQNEGMTCSQAILTVFGPAVGLSADDARTLGRPLCGLGIGKFGVCGYISGGATLLGLSNQHLADEAEARKATATAVDAMCNQFKAKNSHLRCKLLLGADMSTPEGKTKVKENNLIAQHCYDYGRDVAAILEKML